MIEKSVVKELVDEWLAGTDYFLTDLSIDDNDRIVVEIDHKDGVWIDDCVKLSRFIEDHLSRDDEDYELEVGSAGIGQPFKVRRQYQNHVGSEVEAKMKDGRKLRGVLTAAGDDTFTLSVPTRVKPEGAKRSKTVTVDHTLPYDEAAEVKAVIDFK